MDIWILKCKVRHRFEPETNIPWEPDASLEWHYCDSCRLWEADSLVRFAKFVSCANACFLCSMVYYKSMATSAMAFGISITRTVFLLFPLPIKRKPTTHQSTRLAFWQTSVEIPSRDTAAFTTAKENAVEMSRMPTQTHNAHTRHSRSLPGLRSCQVSKMQNRGAHTHTMRFGGWR